MNNNPLTMFWKKIDNVAQLGHPVGAIIEITNRCNASCPFCYIPNQTSPTELSTEQLYYVINKLDSAGILYLSVTGGEPFLRKDIISVLDAIAKKNFFILSIFSNGTLLTDDHISFLQEHHALVSPFRMTVFSHHSSEHDPYTGISGGLNKIITNGHKLMAAGVPVKLAYIVTDFNLDSLNESLSFFKREGFDIGISITKQVTKYNRNRALDYMTSKSFYKKVFSSVEQQFIASDINRYRTSLNKNQHNNALCRGMQQTITIDTDGMIHPCVSFRELSYCSIFNDAPLSELLPQSSCYNEIVRMTKADLPCNTCRHVPYCNPCIGAWYSETGNLEDTPAAICNYAAALSEYCKEIS